MSYKFKFFISILTCFFMGYSYAQESPFEISLEPINISELGGLQSFAFGQYEGKWLLVGGRLDGLHQRQPWAAFDLAGHNNQLIVVDPLTEEKWTAPLTSLPETIQEHLSSTNMEFYQDGDYLYVLGGYGYSALENDHTTFGALTAINIPDVINAIINDSEISEYFRQITDDQFQVTGGRLKKIGDTFYLMGGQTFIGRYNPMGPDFGPGFYQEYTDAVRKFNLSDDGSEIIITHLPSYLDSDNLHRRDYNAEPQILPNGNEGITMFSGVFQPDVNLPFLNSVTLDSDSYEINNSFQQYYNHYHCPSIPLYSEAANEMHTIFFGGIAQFYDSDGTLMQDDNVPFVNTIARVTRDANGVMVEHKLPVEMPSLLGAGGEFIPNLQVPHFENKVFKLDNITEDSVLVGYIFGGISSTQPNIFFINDGTQSDANSMLFKVYVKPNSSLNVDHLNGSSSSQLNLMVYPNPNQGELNISFHLTKRDDVTISIQNAEGVLVEKISLANLDAGENSLTKSIGSLISGSIYFITVETSLEEITHKLIIAD